MNLHALARDVHRRVTLQRRMGDALTRSGRIDEANEAFSKALKLIDEILPNYPALSSNGVDEIEVDRALAVETAELWGERGGVLRRLGRLEDARRSYAHGASFEEVHDLPSTYNRVNALKLGLMTGQTLASISTAVAAARDALQVRLSSDERAADDAWLWSDLGDLQLLLGDVDEALSAYRIFVARARTDSPGLTLSVLQDVAEALERNGDPSAGIIKSGAVQVEMEMAK